MSAKAALKGIQDLVKQSKWDDVITQSAALVDRDAKNYQAHVFWGFALEKKSRLDEAEKAYLAATAIRAKEAQAWQGLIKVYERTGPAKLIPYREAALRVAEIFRDAGDMYRCQDVVDKFITFARSQGERSQVVDALSLILPDSPIYPALEGRVPHPSKTYETIAGIVEAEEKKTINTLIGERRTRIGARLNDVTLEVKREVYQQSKLEQVYRELINWTTDDELRRTYEEKLLQYCYDRLLAASKSDQSRDLDIVQGLANDMVIIKHPFRLAWDIAIDWKDYKDIKEWDFDVLQDYCTFFPDSDLYRVIMGFLTSSVSPFPRPAATKAQEDETGQEEESQDDSDGGAPTSFIPVTDEDRLLLMTDGIATADSLFAYRLMGEYYQHLEEYESNVELMRKAMTLIQGERAKTGLQFPNTADAFALYLGTALVFYQSPRHHEEAKNLFEEVLSHDESRTGALIGIGLIYEEEEDYDAAIDFLDRALERDPTNLRVRSEAAWVKALKGNYDASKAEFEECIGLLEAEKQGNQELLAQTKYRLGWCLWNVDTSKSARRRRDGPYAYFLAALKHDFNFAPAYTSLGLFYADYAKDIKRARRCFQKAVELSPSEVEAAERLAKSFADEGDWDRVELVAQRVVDSGKVRPPPGSKRKGLSWPFAALGVAELNKQDFHKAIVSFQSALRIAPEDYHCWVGLGESYYSSGRFVAATKAILNAQSLEEKLGDSLNDTWFTKFMLANVRRELAEFDDAIALYQEVAHARPDEQGVALALMQTMVESALHSIEKGLFGKSIALALSTLDFASSVAADIVGTFNFWKAVGDACSVFSLVQSRAGEFPTATLKKLLADAGEAYDLFSEIDRVGTEVIFAKGIFPDDEKLGVDLTRCVHATILCHKRAVHVSANDIHAQAVAYFNLGWAEHRGHSCLPADLRRKSSRYLKAAVRCFKRAIELEAGNSEFWNALGVVTSQINPAVSQHAFVRSLHLNERSPVAWTNLGTLALLQNDFKVANEAFTRAQSNDPDYAHAWLGQGFVALMYGDPGEARGLFTHAMGISESSSVATRQQYSVSVFDYILSGPSGLTATSLIQPLFALRQLQGLQPQEMTFGHLSTQFQERTGHSKDAIAALEKVCATLEADYEATESSKSLARFALGRTDLARSYLASGEYDKAVECAEMALQLSSDESDNELTKEERKKARLSAHLTVGLAQYYLDDVDEAVSYFEAALDESDGNPDAVCLLAQVLWATGSEDAREKARSLLFDVIDKDATHVPSVLLLGVVALLDNDSESLEAVAAELHTLRTSDIVSDAQHSDIGVVLRAITALTEGATDNEIRTQAQTDVLLYPHLPHGWTALADITGDDRPADMALQVARKAIPPRGTLEAEDLSRALAGAGKAADAQVAVFLAPWEKGGWNALADAVEALMG